MHHAGGLAAAPSCVTLFLTTLLLQHSGNRLAIYLRRPQMRFVTMKPQNCDCPPVSETVAKFRWALITFCWWRYDQKNTKKKERLHPSNVCNEKWVGEKYAIENKCWCSNDGLFYAMVKKKCGGRQSWDRWRREATQLIKLFPVPRFTPSFSNYLKNINFTGKSSDTIKKSRGRKQHHKKPRRPCNAPKLYLYARHWAVRYARGKVDKQK